MAARDPSTAALRARRLTRLRFQFSLRVFLVAFTVVCLALGWFAQQAWRQYRIVAAILQAGGRVHYPDKSIADLQPGEIGPTVHEVSGRERHFWLDFVKSPVGADYGGGGNDDSCRDLAELHALEALTLQNSPITDVGLSQLVGLNRLDWLDLDGTKISDDGLAYLKGLSKLDVLVLKHTQVTDNGLEHLIGLRNLKTLFLRGSKATDVGVRRLKQALPGCRVYLTKTEWKPPSQ